MKMSFSSKDDGHPFPGYRRIEYHFDGKVERVEYVLIKPEDLAPIGKRATLRAVLKWMASLLP